MMVTFTCHLMPVLPYLPAFDIAHAKFQLFLIGKSTTFVLLVSVATAVRGNITLGIAVGPCRCITEQLLAKGNVIWTMRERVQLCQDLQTKCALLRESLGVSRINRILRAHGHTILHEEEAYKFFDEVVQWSIERLFSTFYRGRFGTSRTQRRPFRYCHKVPWMLPVRSFQLNGGFST